MLLDVRKIPIGGSLICENTIFQKLFLKYLWGYRQRGHYPRNSIALYDEVKYLREGS